jgi:hypothetical protein
MHLTTQELDAGRAKYRGQIIPADALSAMDAETEARRDRAPDSDVCIACLRSFSSSSSSFVLGRISGGTSASPATCFLHLFYFHPGTSPTEAEGR